MENDARPSWERPLAGRRFAGVSLVLCAKLGVPPGLLRAGFVLDAVLGGCLALALAIFDVSIFGAPLGTELRTSGIALGLAGLFVYPVLALVLPDSARPRRWDFASAFGAILVLMAVGQALGSLMEPYWIVAKDAWHERGVIGLLTWFEDYSDTHGLGAKDLVLVAFFASSSVFVWLNRPGWARFLRSMQVGVSLVVLTVVAVTVGVLVPQMDGFEDRERRVDLEREYADYELFQEFGYQKLPKELEDGHEQYQAFRWAEGYFFYHLLHMYGIGMPTVSMTPGQEEGFERFGLKYGFEERDNKRKQMLAMLTGREKIEEIGAFIHANEGTFWRFFEVCTVLQLNRTYKSNWFAALLTLLGAAIFTSAYKNWAFDARRLPVGLLGGLVAVAFVAALKLTTALSAPWSDLTLFSALLIGAGTILGAGVPRNVLSLQKLGFFVVHNGLLVLLIGGGVSKLFTERGILQLDLRDEGPQDLYWRNFDPMQKTRLPFAVRLDHFARQEWKALEVYFPEEEFTSAPPRYTLWEGRRIDLDYTDDPERGLHPNLRIVVRELHDVVDVGLAHVREADSTEGEAIPLAEVLVTNLPSASDGPDESRLHLIPMLGPEESYRGEIFRDPRGAFRLAAAYGQGPERHFPVADGRLGVLEILVVGDQESAPRAHAVHIGETIELDGGYQVRVVDATGDLDVRRDGREGSDHPLPLEEQPYRLAAIWVDVIPPDGEHVERRVVLEAIDPVQHGLQERFFHAGVVLRFAWDTWTAPGPPRYLLHFGTDRAGDPGGEPEHEGPARLLPEGGDPVSVEPGQRLALPGETGIRALQFLSRAVAERNLSFPGSSADEGWDEDFYSESPRGAVIDVTRQPDTAEERTSRIELATTDYAKANLWFSEDGAIVLRFLENSEMLPFEWRSVLSVFEVDEQGELAEVPLGSEAQREIRVNDYFYYRGYRLFQTNALASRPTYSGIGVVYDPGIPLVLTGMYAIIAGTMIAFLVRPIFKKDPVKGAPRGVPGVEG